MVADCCWQVLMHAGLQLPPAFGGGTVDHTQLMLLATVRSIPAVPEVPTYQGETLRTSTSREQLQVYQSTTDSERWMMLCAPQMLSKGAAGLLQRITSAVLRTRVGREANASTMFNARRLMSSLQGTVLTRASVAHQLPCPDGWCAQSLQLIGGWCATQFPLDMPWVPTKLDLQLNTRPFSTRCTCAAGD
jgi:hypothetical protein